MSRKAKTAVKAKKTFVLDTNVLLSDTDSLNAFDEHDVVIPLAVLEELDNHKNRQDEVGKNARVIGRKLDGFRQNGETSLAKGVKLPGGGTLKVLPMLTDTGAVLPPELTQTKTDNAIIAFALSLSKTLDCTLVSKDINVRIKCDSLGLKSDDYLKMRVASSQDEIYGGVANLVVDPEFIDAFYADENVALDEHEEVGLCPNQILVMKDTTGRSAIGKFVGPCEKLERVTIVSDVFGLKPRNKEQGFALDLLLDDRIKLVSITGAAGCGKTLLALAAGLAQCLGGKDTKYEKLIVSRPVQPMGKDIGFLPGTIEEKMEPWVAPIKDNLSFLLGGRKKTVSKKHGEQDREFKRDPYIDMLFQDKIEIEALTYIRGRSIPNSFMIIDECQNLTVHELKTIITRISEGTKIVLLGDLEQIDNAGVDMFTNGLAYAVEKFKDSSLAGHITLLKGERSALATLAAKIL